MQAPALPQTSCPHFQYRAEANAIIKSSDGVHFYLEQSYLASNSEVFRDLFLSSPPDRQSNLPGVSVPEDSRCVELLLSFCYRFHVSAMTFEELYAVTEATRKYRMAPIQRSLQTFILNSKLAQEEPLGVYALAIQCKWKDAAISAARNSLSAPMNTFRESKNAKYFKQLSGVDVFSTDSVSGTML